MFRRLFWFGMGTGLGFGASFWLTRWVRDTAARYAPERVSSQVSTAVRGIGKDLKEAVAEGRTAMRDRERDLRTQVGTRHLN
ncbi:MAG: hypothetical protein M3Z03_01160 [Actinomycetota bacterium]|nr:hypothetical protein [Actinomycetota bacterium]